MSLLNDTLVSLDFSLKDTDTEFFYCEKKNKRGRILRVVIPRTSHTTGAEGSFVASLRKRSLERGVGRPVIFGSVHDLSWFALRLDNYCSTSLDNIDIDVAYSRRHPMDLLKVPGMTDFLLFDRKRA